MVAFALVLLLASAAGWIAAAGAPPRARLSLRLAAVLYAALALAGLVIGVGLAPAAPISAAALNSIADLVTTLGPAVLCVAGFSAFRRSPRPLSASLVLGFAALAGVAAAATGWRVLAAVPQVLAAIFTFLTARPGLWRKAEVYLALAAFSMLGGAAAQLSGGLSARAGLLLFEAAALIGVGIASNVLVEARTKDDARSAVRRGR